MKEFEFNNIKFYVGQSATENWNLLDTALAIDKSYIWFHLNSFPSPYVIMYSSIKNLEELKLTPQLLYYGASLCKEYSKYKYLNDLKILYMPIKNLTKSDTPGEVIIKGKRKIIKI
jgi:predicted ribosome quality control (RQC) complex YloA/Tae2 family protein